MKFFTFPLVMAVAAVSAVVVVPFLAHPEKGNPGSFALEVTMATTRAGVAQVFYRDATGQLSEPASSRTPVVPGGAPVAFRLPLPPGVHDGLRLDPLDGAGAVIIESVRIVTRSGREVRKIPLTDLTAGTQIATARIHDGRLEISTTPDGDDPQLSIALNPPLELRAPLSERFARSWPLALRTFAALVLLLWLLDQASRLRATVVAATRRLAARPGRAVAAVAAVAVIASAYPVVFLGKSHVSPNFGLHLLYDDIPTLPGATSTISVNGRGADLGAMMWAHLPYSVVEHRALARGELPLWNRYNSLGTPLLGQGQSMFGDPLHLGVILFKGAAWAWDIKFLIAKWLFAFGLGLLVLRLTRHLPAALVVGAAAPFIGFFVYRINHAAYFSLCYAPWPLYCWLRVTQAEGVRAVAGWASGLLLANFALLNSGTVKEAYMLLLTMNFSGFCVLVSDPASWRTRFAKLAALGWAGVLFVLLSAPVWATFLHTLGNAKTNYDVSSAYQIQPSLLLGAFDEAFFRLIMPGEFVFNPSLNFLLLLGLLYFLVTLKLNCAHRPVRAMAVSALVPFALVFGVVPPSWISAVPFLGGVQHIDNCFLCALIVLWSALAGVGFASAAARLGRPEGRSDLAKIAWWLAGIVGAWIAFRQAAHRGAWGPGMTFSVLQPGQILPVSTFIWCYLATLLGASGLLAFVVRRALQRRTLTPASGLMVALCATLLLWRHGLHAEAIGFETHVVHPPARADLHAKSPAMEFARAAQAREPSRGYGMYDNYFMGWTGVYGLEAINGPDALMNPWFRELIAVGGTKRGISWDFNLPPENVAEVRPFFDALNVRYYYSRGYDEEVLRRTLTYVQKLDLEIWESPTVWPRAFFTDRLTVYEQAGDFVKTIKTGDGRPFAAVQRGDPAAPPDLGGELAGRSVAPATNYRLTENTTAFDVHATAPGVIVLSETFWPGDFRAEVNGRKAEVLRLNHTFKGVAVDAPGDYRVIFRYVPRNFPRNLLLSAAGAVLLGSTLLLAFRPPRAA